MDRINIRDLKYEYLTHGSEALIYKTEYGIYKEFLASMLKKVKDNKEKKIILLDEISELKEYYANPLILVDSFFNDFLRGYIIQPCEGRPFDEIFLLPEEKLAALKQTRDIINLFKSHGVMYEDIYFDNIFYDENTKKVKFIDMDNIQIGEYKKDMVSFLTHYYYSQGGKNQKNSMIFCFNLISYMLLSDHILDYKIQYLRDTKERFYLNKDANNLVNELLYTKTNASCDNEYLIDMIDEKVLIK